jgi:two-component system nitrogen regulation response regulator NtrX
MRRILVVDDEAPIREVLIDFLTDHGFEAHGAMNGKQALSLVASLRPQVILLDVSMPGLSGIEVLEKLRGRTPAPAVIMISGHADQDIALKALELGAFDFIQKPLDLRYLERTLLAKIVTLEPAESALP